MRRNHWTDGAVALDTLLVLDLVHADTKALGRYMGLENLKVYRAFHERMQQ